MSVNYTPAFLSLTTSNQTIYTVPDTVIAAIVQFGVCNNVGADTTLTLWVVPDSGSAANTNQYISAKTVSTSTPNPLDAITGMYLESGESIVAVAGANDRLNVRLSILEVNDD